MNNWLTIKKTSNYRGFAEDLLPSAPEIDGREAAEIVELFVN